MLEYTKNLDKMNVLQKIDGSISSPSTPNCSAGGCSSNSNSTNSINSGAFTATLSTPSPTPSSHHQQVSAPHYPTAPAASQAAGAAGSATSSPGGGGSAGSSGHKNSLKGTRLAQRARSFKDDLISLMRTTNNTLGRSHSPHSPRNKHASKPPPTTEEMQKSTQTLETHVKDISNALKHFRDVILKNKLEVLPGNGTVILETIASMYSVIQSYTLNENSAIMSSATQQVYQSLGKLIKLCDEVMLSGDGAECASLSNDNVRKVIDLLEEAVRHLVSLAQSKLKEQDQCAFHYSSAGIGGIGAAADIIGAVTSSTACVGASNSLMRTPVEAVGQRTSLPDIALTPKERDILEQSNANPIRASHSTESILRDTSPPPKPPLPNRSSNPPPLPPKRRSQPQAQLLSQSPVPYHAGCSNTPMMHNMTANSDLEWTASSASLMNYSVDHLSVRSRSPDENSSQCSFDSALNHSHDEDAQQKPLHPQLSLAEDVDKLISYKTRTQLQLQPLQQLDGHALAPNSNVYTAAHAMLEDVPDACQEPGNAVAVATVNSSCPMGQVTTTTGSAAGGHGNALMSAGGEGNTELRKAACALTSNRHSNESGFVSMKSFRTSTQSVSKRSSDYSVQSSTKSSSSNSELAFGISESCTSATTATSLTQQNQRHISASCNSTSTSTTTATSSSSASSLSTTTRTTYSEHGESSAAPAELLTLNHVKLMTDADIASITDEVAPALPPKTTQRQATLDETDDSNAELAELRHLPTFQQQQQQQHLFQSSSTQLHQWQSKHHSLIETPRSSNLAASSCTAFDRNLDEPPPLPMKKKYILAYMEICSASTRSDQHRHTVHTYNLSRNISHSQTMNIMPMSKELWSEHETPPALPPKNSKPRKPTAPPTIITTPPPSPKTSTHQDALQALELSTGHALRNSRMTTVCEELGDEGTTMPASKALAKGSSDSFGGNVINCHSHQLPNETSASGALNTNACAEGQQHQQKTGHSQEMQTLGETEQEPEELAALEDDDANIDIEDEDDEDDQHAAEADKQLPNLLEEIEITPYLILKKNDEDGPEVKGGYIDALIVHASRVQKADNGNAFSEAFITTFRTFIQPIDVIEKLTHRYTYFFCQVQDQKQKAAKETFSLLVRVVNDLTSTDLTSQLLSLLVEFVYQLVCSGQLYLAKLLRNKFVEKVTLYKEQKTLNSQPIERDAPLMVGTGGSGNSSGGGGSSQQQPSLLDLKSLEIAEQMTLLDAELFQKIEIPEVLLFAKDQCEEKSPNLNKFTEHFNKMSYWARSKILLLQDAKEREKHVNKFIKIMKHLRKMNNYNSYLALLSALDSGPIRRLEWQKGTAEEVRSFCALIDSSSSFRAYRQALAETNPPCIPYIGLVLQDLTFVHVGNQDYLSKGVINFSKRWQQYNIIVNMKRFKKCAYPFRRNERIIGFFENFKDFMGEEEMWQISEKIKPRGRRPVNY